MNQIGRITIEILESILAAREHRAYLKKQIALRGLPCMSLSLNVPGYPKSNATVRRFFEYSLLELKYFMKSHLVELHDSMAVGSCDAAGDFFLVPCSSSVLPLAEIKSICENFESAHPMGRFVDVDLNDEHGNTISSGKSKLCFFCRTIPAIECRRQNTHDQEQLRSWMFSKMDEYCLQQRESAKKKKLASLALKALLYEISLSPKPGLVDKFSNGSHTDMNYLTFIDSSAAVSVWFGELVHEGFSFKEEDATKALPIIRNIGLRMEAAMNEATGNVNTQKGIIFLMGLSLFACGRLYSQYDRFDPEIFREILRSVCRGLVQKELKDIPFTGKSHGEEIFHKHGISGARGEAESGFNTVFQFGLPLLKGTAALTDMDMIKCFLSIASNNKDTNILYRGGPAVLASFQNLCNIALKSFNGGNFSNVEAFCERENISPGGSADLLVVSIFLWSVMHADQTDSI